MRRRCRRTCTGVTRRRTWTRHASGRLGGRRVRVRPPSRRGARTGASASNAAKGAMAPPSEMAVSSRASVGSRPAIESASSGVAARRGDLPAPVELMEDVSPEPKSVGEFAAVEAKLGRERRAQSWTTPCAQSGRRRRILRQPPRRGRDRCLVPRSTARTAGRSVRTRRGCHGQPRRRLRRQPGLEQDRTQANSTQCEQTHHERQVSGVASLSPSLDGGLADSDRAVSRSARIVAAPGQAEHGERLGVRLVPPADATS